MIPGLQDPFVASRLKGFEWGHKHVSLPETITMETSSRAFLSATYGGSSQSTYPKIARDRFSKHGKNDFCYPSLLYNPSAPSKPGAPGLFYEYIGVATDVFKKPLRVITRIAANKWRYVGQYEIKPDKSLSIREWKSQDLRVRKAWVDKMAAEWGPDLRIRVGLREVFGREPTAKEVRENTETFEVTNEEIMQAFDCGQETIAVYTMRCVGYDAEFQEDVVKRFKTWVPPPPRQGKSKRKGKTPKGKGKGPKEKGKKDKGKSLKETNANESKPVALGKRKRTQREDGDSDDVDYEEETYRSNGTRSRPIIVE
ncbi:hypothetical protein C8J56DRAFT_799817 [Mycena floridula]|nr:hypothetical protein C8J56DRAFT_799817 [Mycena floridula]